MHVEFVETEQAQARLEDGLDHCLDRIGIVIPAARRLAESSYACMHLVHEFMEMHAPLFPEGDGGKEQVHQHGLAAPDLAMEVESAHGLGGFLEEAKDPFGPVGDQIVQDPVELPRRFHLRRIRRQRAAGDELVIGSADGGCGGKRCHQQLPCRGRDPRATCHTPCVESGPRVKPEDGMAAK
jgi:hypothetical protein